MDESLALDQAGVPQFADGRHLSLTEREEYAVKLGKCPKCGVQVRSLSARKLLTFGSGKKISNDDVYEGFCIPHAPPGKVPAHIIASWEIRHGARATTGGIPRDGRSHGSTQSLLLMKQGSNHSRGSVSHNNSVRSAPARTTHTVDGHLQRLSATDEEIDNSENAEESVSDVTESEASHDHHIIQEASVRSRSTAALPQIQEKGSPLPSMHTIADLHIRAQAIRRAKSSNEIEISNGRVQQSCLDDDLHLMRTSQEDVRSDSSMPYLENSNSQLNGQLSHQSEHRVTDADFTSSPRQVRSRDRDESSQYTLQRTSENVAVGRSKACERSMDMISDLPLATLDERKFVGMRAVPSFMKDGDPRSAISRYRSFNLIENRPPVMAVRRPLRDGTERIIPVRNPSRQLGDMVVPGIRGRMVKEEVHEDRGIRRFHSSDEMGFELLALAHHASMDSQDREDARYAPRRALSRTVSMQRGGATSPVRRTRRMKSTLRDNVGISPPDASSDDLNVAAPAEESYPRRGLVREKSTIASNPRTLDNNDVTKLIGMVLEMDKKMDGFMKIINDLRSELDRERELRYQTQVELQVEKEERLREKIEMLEKDLDRARSEQQPSRGSHHSDLHCSGSVSSFPQESLQQSSQMIQDNDDDSDSEETIDTSSTHSDE